MKLISTIVSVILIIVGIAVIVIYAESPWSNEIREINKVNSKYSIDIKSDFYGRGDKNLYPFGSLVAGTQTLLLTNLVNQKIKTNIVIQIENVECESNALITISNGDSKSNVVTSLITGRKNTVMYPVILGPHETQINYFYLQFENADKSCSGDKYPFAITDWKYRD